MASRQRVEQKLEELISRLDGGNGQVRESLRDSLPEPRVLSVHLTDLQATYWARLDEGRMGELRPDEPEEAHIRITVSSDDLIDLLDGRQSLLPAVFLGRIKVDASPADLMRLRRLLV